jgi:hypothetical protein
MKVFISWSGNISKALRATPLIAVGLVFFAVADTSAFDEPDNFRGIKWGSSPAEATRITGQLREKGNDWEKVTDLGDGMLHFSDTFGSIYTAPGYDGIPITFVMNFIESQFVAAQIGFQSEDFTKIEEIFVKRYGRPTRVKNTEMQNAMRAKFMNREIEWNGKKVTITLVKYAGNVTSGSGFIGQRTWLEHRARQSRKRATDAAKGL